MRYFLRTRLIGNVHELAERIHVVHGEIGENLAVHIDAGQLQAVDHAAVRSAANAGARIDARDPQLAVFALLQLASDLV